ncbi:PIG-L family deacetylase [Mangrovivirga cuniculi]|nr:PIG-L family deacetylase [Mangrovivirga cuniculi]
MKKLFLLFLFTSFVFSNLSAQEEHIISPPASSVIADEIKGLKSFIKVLYVAAHPDDENTRLITYFARYKHFETGYLSMTRGDGGQNLIGSEIRDGLGLIRTQELIAARKIDGGNQFFTTANDFGYSKNPTETFNKWNREKVLGDAVYVIRKFRPDIIITRFPEIPGITHGHHTASAIIAREAFDLANDPSAYPEQLDHVKTWQPKKIYWNTSPWFYRGRDESFDTTNLVKLNVGHYLPSMGESIEEVAGRSRSMHKSQGFGSSGSRGESFEWLVPVKAVKGSEKDFYSGIKTSWAQMGAPNIEKNINKIINSFNPLRPENSIEDLVQLKNEIRKTDLKNEKVESKLSQIDELIVKCLGLYAGLHSDRPYYSPGDTVEINFEAINRSDIGVKISKINIPGTDIDKKGNLNPNKTFEFSTKLVLPSDIAFTDPYWLNGNQTDANFDVSSFSLIGNAENHPVYHAEIILDVYNELIKIELPLTYHTTDRVKGKVIQPMHIMPEISVEPLQKVLVLPVNKEKSIIVTLTSDSPLPSGELTIDLPAGIKCEKEVIKYEADGVERVRSFEFHISAEKATKFEENNVSFEFNTKQNEKFDQYTVFIEYDHIPNQIDVRASEMTVSAVDIDVPDVKVGYIMGAGDDVPNLLTDVGMYVDQIGVEDLNGGKNIDYDVIILGIRALNTNSELARSMDKLYNFVYDGGTVIVQYNTSYGLNVENPGPYPISISRGRVTDENSEVRILNKDHIAFNQPNKITEDDFKNWVQERGLYFPGTWDDNYTPLLSISDTDEVPLKGSLLVAEYGEGYYVYTGLSFFRELPAGVPGAYRLLINLISLSHSSEKP